MAEKKKNTSCQNYQIWLETIEHENKTKGIKTSKILLIETEKVKDFEACHFWKSNRVQFPEKISLVFLDFDYTDSILFDSIQRNLFDPEETNQIEQVIYFIRSNHSVESRLGDLFDQKFRKINPHRQTIHLDRLDSYFSSSSSSSSSAIIATLWDFSNLSSSSSSSIPSKHIVNESNTLIPYQGKKKLINNTFESKVIQNTLCGDPLNQKAGCEPFNMDYLLKNCKDIELTQQDLFIFEFFGFLILPAFAKVIQEQKRVNIKKFSSSS